MFRRIIFGNRKNEEFEEFLEEAIFAVYNLQAGNEVPWIGFLKKLARTHPNVETDPAKLSEKFIQGRRRKLKGKI